MCKKNCLRLEWTSLRQIFIELTKKPSLALENHIEYSAVDNR